MITALLLFLVPTLLFVLAFLAETYFSFKRINSPKDAKDSYVAATWEVTHTLLVFAVVMLFMMFTSVIDKLAALLFVSAFVALLALTLRAVLYIYIFYGRKKRRSVALDWLFALTHVFAALSLVVVVLQAVDFILRTKPAVNTQFFPYVIPGLLGIIALCIIPFTFLYAGNYFNKKLK